jgi:hypothetical protein
MVRKAQKKLLRINKKTKRLQSNWFGKETGIYAPIRFWPQNTKVKYELKEEKKQ